MQCDMCGKEGFTIRALVEGTELDVCKACARFGKAIPKRMIRKAQEKKEPLVPKTEMVETIVEDYGKRIHDARQRMGLKQIEFAKRIAEKESLIQKIESGAFKPSIEMARKLESMLKIKLVEENEVIHGTVGKKKSSTFTLGDFVTVKKRSK